MTADITVVGLGVAVADHVTPESDRALREVHEILYVDTGVATRAFLEERCPRVTDLYEACYRAGGDRLTSYHHMAARVVDAALDHGPVAFAVQGHPTIFSYPPFLVRDAAELVGLTTRILPAISSMDTLFAELMVDPGPMGLQMYEATDMLLRKRPLLTDVPLLLWQVGALETRLHTVRASDPQRYARFQAHLLEHYPADHVVTAYYGSPHPLVASAIAQFPIGELLEHTDALDGGVTLYVPPAHQRPILDGELFAQLRSADHLGRITR